MDLKHVFFCLNLRENGRKCCQDGDAKRMREYAKVRVKALNLSGAGGIRVNQSGCLGRCLQGPSIVIYPDNVWYTYQGQADIDEIIDQHLRQGKIVTRLLMDPQEQPTLESS